MAASDGRLGLGHRGDNLIGEVIDQGDKEMSRPPSRVTYFKLADAHLVWWVGADPPSAVCRLKHGRMETEGHIRYTAIEGPR